LSVNVADFKPAGGGWIVVHDDAPGGLHGGLLAATDITFGQQPDGSPDYRQAVINCPFPGCGSTSYHPIGGGAAPRSVQEMFIRMVMRVGCPCGAFTAGKSAVLTIIHLKGHVQALEGAARWQVASIVP
jgi:hypothetical protein